MALALGVVIVTDRQFRRFHLFGRCMAPDWPRFAAICPHRPADRPDHGVRRAVFGAAAYLMGLIDAESSPPTRSRCRSRR